MKAEIKPLHGKYYGTEIKLENGERIVVWLRGDGKPSRRELEGITYEEAVEDDYFCDSHYETEFCLSVCEAIVKALEAK